MNQQITLLDGTTWKKEELLSRMYDDKFYYGYLGGAALSSSSAKKLLDSPKKYTQSLTEDNSNVAALRDGRLFHVMALNNRSYRIAICLLIHLLEQQINLKI